MTSLHVEFRSHSLEGHQYSVDHRWEMARKFMSEHHLDPRTRVAGLLLLLYDIYLARIVTIKCADVEITSRPVKLTIGADPIELPETLGNAIIELVDATKLHSEGWLFPGRNPGAHLSSEAMSRRLRKEGLIPTSARTTALIELSRQIHPRVVSDLLGITPASAVAWARLAGGDWLEYPGLHTPPD